MYIILYRVYYEGKKVYSNFYADTICRSLKTGISSFKYFSITLRTFCLIYSVRTVAHKISCCGIYTLYFTIKVFRRKDFGLHSSKHLHVCKI